MIGFTHEQLMEAGQRCYAWLQANGVTEPDNLIAQTPWPHIENREIVYQVLVGTDFVERRVPVKVYPSRFFEGI